MVAQLEPARRLTGNLELLEVRRVLAQFGFAVHDIDAAQAAAEPPMILADLDGDDDLDMLSKNIWRPNDGSGHFGPTRLMFTGQAVDQLFAADLDGDGDIDVLATGGERKFSAPTVFAWYENLDGRGTLSAARLIDRFENLRYSSVTGGDLDGDGDIDLLETIDGAVRLYENIDGRGTFAPSTTWQGYTLSTLYDIDGDSDLDIVASHQTANRLDWLENRGGDFVVHQLLNEVGRYLIDDVNRDGVLDFIFGGLQDVGLHWYELERASETLSKRETIQSIGSMGGILRLATGDIDGDGDLDLASVYIADSPSTNYHVAVYLLADDSYGDAQRQAGEEGPSNGSGLALDDLDGNGTADLIYVNAVQFFDVASGQLGTPTPLARLSRQFDGKSIVADIDRDGDDDVIASDVTDYCYVSYDYCTTRLQWYENTDGRGNFLPRGEIWQEKSLANFQGIRALEAADVDGDGDLDIAFQTYEVKEEIFWLENSDGKGTFGVPRLFLAGTLIAIVDLDHDGRDDIVTYVNNEFKLDFNLAGPNRELLPLPASFGGLRAQDHLVDWDGDADLDVVTLLSGEYFWYENLGNRVFAPQQTIIGAQDDNNDEIRLFPDLNGDGIRDTLWRLDDATVVWREGLGGVFWGPPQVLAERSYVWDIADFDNDNDLDLLMSGLGENDPRIYLNDRSGNFVDSDIVLSRSATQWIDMDLDGDLDILDTQRRVWYERRIVGDVNGDGIFNSSDLVTIFQSGQYEDWLDRNSTFETGDFNGDGEFDSSDLVAAFQAGAYVA